MPQYRAAILRMEGTNNEAEVYRAFEETQILPEYVHIKELEKKQRSLEEFQALFIPGGFSAGDYIRAGILFAARLMESSRAEIEKFVDEKKPVIGTCNGFQVLAESGLLPDIDGKMSRDMVLSVNRSGRFECRTVYIKFSGNNHIMSSTLKKGQVLQVPVAHKEGQVIFRNRKVLEKLHENGQAIFTYVDEEGRKGEYPWNPNGSVDGIAGICNPEGNVIGLMPHPERAFNPYNMSGREREGKTSTGRLFFKAIYNYINAHSL